MGDNKGETTKKQSQTQQQSQTQKQPQQQQQQVSSSSPKDPLLDQIQIQDQTLPHIISSSTNNPLFIPTGATSSSPFDQVQFDQTATNNPKRTRYTTTTGQWKLLPSPKASQQQKIIPVPSQITVLPSTDSPPIPLQPQTQQLSSSDTASSPSQSLPSLSAASGQEKPESDSNPVHHQFRKGKYVSPVWKPSEMLWLARAWRVQYQTAGSRASQPDGSDIVTASGSGGGQSKGKTRSDKDREVAEFLNRHGVNRDAKTAGTKWDNMLGEFRKVYEWERGGEREQVGKSYFRLSPYERKLHRLPASFDEEVFEELSQFMGSRLRSSSSSSPQSARSGGLISGGTIINVDDSLLNRSRALLPVSKEDDQFALTARTKQLIVGSGSGGGEAYYGYGGRQSGTLIGFDQTALLGDVNVVGPSPPSKEVRRIGKVRMTWEESVSVWAEEGENHRGRVRLHGGSLSFLNADELTYFDEAMVASTMEGFEEGPLKGFSVDRFVPGQQVKVFGRKKSPISSLPPNTSTISSSEKLAQLPFTETSIRSIPPWEFQDPTEYYIGCLRVPPPSIPSLFELSWYIQEPPPEELRLPLRKDVYRDLPQGKDLFFTISTEPLDCRGFTHDILSPILRPNPSLAAATATSRDSFLGLWDDCINRIVSKFCSADLIAVRKPSISPNDHDDDHDHGPLISLQDQWPNFTGLVRSLCLWRGDETDRLREGQIDPSNSIAEKIMWTYGDLPYVLGYYAVGFIVTLCALSRDQDRIIRTDLQTLDLSSPSDRLKALVPCYRIAGLLPLLAERCFNSGGPKTLVYSDFERFESNGGNVTEMTPNTVTRFYQSRRKWAAVKEIYDFLDHRIPHAEFVHRSSEKELSLVFKPRGVARSSRPSDCEQLVEALKHVTKALVALHDLSFMHRDLSWEKVVRRADGGGGESEWFVAGFEEAVGAPQIYPHYAAARGGYAQAPEMERGLHGVKVDVWGVGNLVRTWFGGAGVSPAVTTAAKMLRELQDRCLEQNPEVRPTAADCYHHLLQLQSTHQLHSSV